MATAAFWILIALTVSHEIDATRRNEWRILPLTSFLPEQTARIVFIWAHLPLTILLIWIAIEGANSNVAYWLSVFMIIHVALHWLYRNHPKNEFGNAVSWGLILGAGIAGSAHILLAI